MPKMKTMNFRMALNPKASNEIDLDIFDDIGEWADWDGKIYDIGPKKIAQFLSDHADADTINVRINSRGGDVFEGVAVYNLLKGSGKTINVKIVGVAASIASVIAMAGDKIEMPPTAQMMVHNCWCFCIGNSAELRKRADDMDKIMESVKIAYLNKAGDKLSAEKLDELLANETYLTASECKSFGLCTADDEEDKDESPEEGKEEKPKDKSIDPILDLDEPSPKMPWFF